MSFKKNTERVIAFIIKPFVFVWFWFILWVKHNKSAKSLNNTQKMGARDKPSIVSLPFVYTDHLISLIKRVWTVEFSEYALKKYEHKRFAEKHYSKEGRAYFNFDKLSQADCLEMYNKLTGRIAHHITHNPSILDYKDGDSFLDAGCGMGQNIKELVVRYPNSPIKGFDFSKEALRVIREGLKKNSNVSVEVGSIVDFQYLESYPNGSFDHFIISHVFSFMVGSGIDETRKLRQKLIDHFVRIAAKSVLILDRSDTILSENKVPEVAIGQLPSRCFLRESLLPYFSRHISNGELYAMLAPTNEGIVFKCRSIKKP